MQKLFLIAFFAGLLSVLSVTAVQAAPAPRPGCGTDMLDVQKNHADSMRVRDKSYTREIIKRNDPALGMTCFDRAMSVTARLGNIFSDVFTPVSAIANTNVFTGGSDTATSIIDNFLGANGKGNLLVFNLDNVITPTLSEYLNDFTGTLSEILGTTIGNFLSSVTGAISGVLSTLSTLTGAIGGTITSILGYISTIQTIAAQLGLALPQALVLAITAALKIAQGFVDTLVAAVVALINSIVDGIMTAVMGLVNTLSDLTCNRIADLWNDGDPTSGAESVEGNGIEFDTPYFTYVDLLSGAPPGAGPDMLGELDNAFNMGILGAAMSDMTTLLNAPCGVGNLKTWKRAPIIPVNTTVAGIIGMMADPCP